MAQRAPTQAYRPSSIERLVGTNYLVWRVRMEVFVRRQELWDLASGTSVCLALRPQNPTVAEQIAYDEWKRKDLAARTELLLALGDRQVQMVRDCVISHGTFFALTTSIEILLLM